MELYKKIPNATGGEYVDKTTLERCDLITAEVRFYCPPGCGCGTGLGDCGTEGTCCKRFETVEEAMEYFNVQKYEDVL
jgi:hypothetical protein